MQHWYVYHSDKTMGYTYASTGISAFYLKTDKANHVTLYKNHIIWVIEGNLQTPCQFKLVDCFHYLRSEEPPFNNMHGKFSGTQSEFNAIHIKFTRRIFGNSLLSNPISLDKEDKWFDYMHKKRITKQKFFCPLTNLEVEGLKEISGIKFSYKQVAR